MIWYATIVKRMEEGRWVEQRKGELFTSDPTKAYVPVVLHEDYLALQADLDRHIQEKESLAAHTRRYVAALEAIGGSDCNIMSQYQQRDIARLALSPPQPAPQK